MCNGMSQSGLSCVGTALGDIRESAMPVWALGPSGPLGKAAASIHAVCACAHIGHLEPVAIGPAAVPAAQRNGERPRGSTSHQARSVA